jgi:hypothetical protein
MGNAIEGAIMRGIWGMAAVGMAVLVAGCISTPSLTGTTGARSFAALQEACNMQPVDYGNDAQSVYTVIFDAHVASRRGRISNEEFCAFQNGLAQQYTKLGKSSDPAARDQWVTFFNLQRAKAISWRASVDPSLRSG